MIDMGIRYSAQIGILDCDLQSLARGSCLFVTYVIAPADYGNVLALNLEIGWIRTVFESSPSYDYVFEWL